MRCQGNRWRHPSQAKIYPQSVMSSRSPLKMGSPLVHRARLYSLHGRKCHKVSAQVMILHSKGNTAQRRVQRTRLLPGSSHCTSSEANTASPDEATSLVLSGMAATSLPQLWNRGHVGLHLMRSALKLISLYSSQTKLKTRSNTEQQCYFCFVPLVVFLRPSFYC